MRKPIETHWASNYNYNRIIKLEVYTARIEKKLKEAIEHLKEIAEYTEKTYQEIAEGGDLWDERFGDDWGHISDFLKSIEKELL